MGGFPPSYEFPTVRQVEAKYNAIRAALARKAASSRPRLPALRRTKATKAGCATRGRFTLLGLMLTYFAMNMKRIVDKVELVKFLRRMRASTTDPQPRHLGMQMGFDFLVAGCKHPVSGVILKRGQYCLMSLSPSKQPHILAHRCMRVTNTEFVRLKKRFECRCAVCGSMEGKPHLKNKRLETRIEKGHMDPRKELDLANCIPMCSMCNGVYKDKAVFNRNGYIRTWLRVVSLKQ